MNYIVQRRPDPAFWRWYAEHDRAGTPIALQTLHLRRDGDTDTTSHVGRQQIRDFLVNQGFPDDPGRWPVAIAPAAALAA